MTSRRAFTLIEVLLSVFIIALGSIGILALLAGVAQQQSRASDLSRGVAQAQGLIGALDERVGPLGEWRQPSGFPDPDPVFGVPIARGVWYPAFAYDDTGGTDFPALSVNPQAVSDIEGGRYFVAPSEEHTIYSNPPVLISTSPLMYQPLYGAGAALGNNVWSGSGAMLNGADVSRLPFTRAALGTVEIEFWKTNQFTGIESIAFSVDDSELTTILTDDDILNDDSEIMPRGAMIGSDPFVEFLYAERAGSPPVLADPLNQAGVLQFNLQNNVGINEWISSIRIRAAHRKDQLLSLGERVFSAVDPTRPSGRRATAGATVLYRLTPSGRSQFISIGYAVTPLDRSGTYVPPERHDGVSGAGATNGLLRVSDDYRLYYDATRSEYYLTWMLDDDALATGDVLVVGGELTATPTSDRNRQGADNPVTVTRVLDLGTEVRAYLNDSPRTRARSMLENINDTGGVPLFRVYSLRRQVRSQSDNSLWEVRPVVAQTLDVQ
ncbi:MAG: type IV pilus modification PilV family protein [Phycisphaerales bacterium]